MNTKKSALCALLIATSAVLLFAENNNSATEVEMAKYHEKYLKNKLHNEQQSEISKMIKYQDVAAKKIEANVTMQELNTPINQKIFAPKEESKEAVNIEKLINNKDFIKTVKEHKRFILEDYEIGGHKMNLTKEQKEAIATGVKNVQQSGENEKIFIIISSSMPKTQIKEYFKMVDGKPGVEFVLRGLVGEGVKKFEPTRKYIEDLMLKSEKTADNYEAYSVSVSINPKIVKKYDIQKVPAVIYVKNYNNQAEKYEALDKSVGNNEEFWVSYGLANLDYVLEKINKEANSQFLENFLKPNGFFNN